MNMNYQDWVGNSETTQDRIGLAQALAAAALFDDSRGFSEGQPLPPLWHWFYFLPKVPQSRLGSDGHPQRGGFMPPIDLPRRMFAGARLRFRRPLRIGWEAQRESLIREVSLKEGRSGRLAFVTVYQQIRQDDEVCIEEEQDIVYREQGAPVPAPAVIDWPPLPPGCWTRTIIPDPTQLFRFSALTFNAHRIHYDRPYAMDVEGYPGLIVHGPLTAMLLLDLVRSGTERPVTAFSFRGLGPLFDLAPFRLLGLPGESGVDLSAQGPDGQISMKASAELG